MNETTILQHLEEIAEKLNLKVNYENLRKLHIFSKGGFYRLQEDHIVLIENTLNLSEKIDILADALGNYDLEDVYYAPCGEENTGSESKHKPHRRYRSQ